jgi:hypothetical protein
MPVLLSLCTPRVLLPPPTVAHRSAVVNVRDAQMYSTSTASPRRRCAGSASGLVPLGEAAGVAGVQVLPEEVGRAVTDEAGVMQYPAAFGPAAIVPIRCACPDPCTSQFNPFTRYLVCCEYRVCTRMTVAGRTALARSWTSLACLIDMPGLFHAAPRKEEYPSQTAPLKQSPNVGSSLSNLRTGARALFRLLSPSVVDGAFSTLCAAPIVAM